MDVDVDEPFIANQVLQDCAERYATNGIYAVKGWGRNFPVLKAERVEDEKDRLEGFNITTIEKQKQVTYFVEPQKYIRPVIRDKFTTDHVDGSKMGPNTWIFHFMNQHPRMNRKVLYLDSPTGLTTYGLYAMGLRRDALHLPNPDPDFKAKCSEWMMNEVTFYPSTVFECIRDWDEELSPYTSPTPH